MDILNIENAIKMTVKDFSFENCYKRIGFTKKEQLLFFEKNKKKDSMICC